MKYVKYQKYMCTLFWVLLVGSIAEAQPGGVPDFWHLTPQEGLSQSTGQAIIQDSEGYMWIGTQDGLNKYDGYEITVYKNQPADSSSLSYNDVSTLLLDQDSTLWIGTLGGGLNRYNAQTDDFTVFAPNGEHPEKGIAESSIFALHEDSGGNLWIGTENGLSKKEPDQQKFTHFYADENDDSSLTSSEIQAIFEDSRGNLWVGTRNGLNRMKENGEGFVNYYHDENEPSTISHNGISVIFEDRQGNLWIGTSGGGLNRYRYADDSFERFQHNPKNQASISDDYILSIAEDSQGTLWIGTTNGGLNVLDRETKRFTHYMTNPNDAESLNNNAIFSIYENDDQILWIGTFTGGINITDLKASRFQHIKPNPTRPNALNNSSVLSFLEDKSGNFWVGTDGDQGGGLSKANFGQSEITFTHFGHDELNPNSLPSNVVLQLLNAGPGSIWIGTYQGGVSKFNYNTEQFEHYPFTQWKNKRPNSDVYALYEDRRGNLWAGTNGGGIQVMRAGTDDFVPVQEAPRDDGLATNFVRNFLEDDYGNLWVGTYGSGLAVFDRDTETFSFYSEANSSLNNGVIFSLYEDSKNRMWIGTKGGGLNRYHHNENRFTHYTTEDGLPNNIINGIVEDDEGYLWLSTNNGISRFNPKTETFANYGAEDGLQDSEFILKSAYKDSEGYLYFGGINGFNRFHPKQITADTTVHPVKLTGFQVNNQLVSPGGGSYLKRQIHHAREITLPHDVSVFTIKYAALNFNLIKGNTYAYMLEGFDTGWNKVGQQRTATYTNLDPGAYTFKVKAANNDGFWSENVASVRLIITPPFWQTSWFYALAVLSVIGMVWGGYKWRTRQITRVNRLLEQEVANRTSELEQSNLELKQAMQDLKETRQELVDNAHKAGMADIATGVLHNIGNVLNSIITSTSINEEVLRKTKLEKLFKANELVKEHQDNLEEFLANDPRGAKVVMYYLRLEESLRQELKTLRENNQRLDQKTSMIQNVIAAQQNYANIGMNSETGHLETIVDDTLTIFGASLQRHGIRVQKEFASTPPVQFQKAKLVHVLLNLFKNAKEALDEAGSADKQIRLSLQANKNYVQLEIADNGPGISSENAHEIFNHGFTTKKEGHGFGLHSCANYMAEMNGDIQLKQNGSKIKEETIFMLRLPIAEGHK